MRRRERARTDATVQKPAAASFWQSWWLIPCCSSSMTCLYGAVRSCAPEPDAHAARARARGGEVRGAERAERARARAVRAHLLLLLLFLGRGRVVVHVNLDIFLQGHRAQRV